MILLTGFVQLAFYHYSHIIHNVDKNLKFCGSNAHCEMVTLPHFASFNDREGLVGVVFDLVQNTKHRVDGTTNLLLCERKRYLRHVSYILGRNISHNGQQFTSNLALVCTFAPVSTGCVCLKQNFGHRSISNVYFRLAVEENNPHFILMEYHILQL